MPKTPCESCSMPTDPGPYCRHCIDAEGKLQSFDERFERMVAWQQSRTPQASRAELESATLALMAKMPAWKGHPRVAAAARKG